MASANEFDLPETDDDDIESGQSEGKALRSQLKRALAELKETRSERDTLKSQVRNASLKDVFADAGVNAKYAKFYDGEDLTVEAVKAWGLENDFIAADAGDDVAPTGEPGVPNPAAAVSQLVQKQVATAAPPATDMLAMIQNASSFDELVKSGAIKLV